MRIHSHLIYLSLIALVTVAWLYERTDNSQSSSSPVLKQPAALPVATPEFRSPDAPEIAARNNAKGNNVQTETKPSGKAESPRISGPVTTQELVAKRIKDTATRFERQNYQSGWSFEAQQKVSDFFIIHAKELENFDVLDVDCKQTVCRIQSEISGEHFMEIMELHRLLEDQPWFSSSDETLFTTNDNDQPHDIYISIEH